ncbi:hypothetical protein [Methylomagnum ishizawai]|uniref:hypothetical protein n=1 Tax=Methylomagnum ishizawai TaxID=1760988 RepID=UPI001C322AED|nr:hypothetical protein [Methylomagnum ishizawai]BBL73184.1 hypothetical protein MishRS11D_02820 [Methylomagnum ishizawai]
MASGIDESRERAVGITLDAVDMELLTAKNRNKSPEELAAELLGQACQEIADRIFDDEIGPRH